MFGVNKPSTVWASDKDWGKYKVGTSEGLPHTYKIVRIRNKVMK